MAALSASCAASFPQKAKPSRQPVADVDVPLIWTELGHEMMSKLGHAVQQSRSRRLVFRNNSCSRGLVMLLTKGHSAKTFFASCKIFESKMPRFRNDRIPDRRLTQYLNRPALSNGFCGR